MDWGTILTSTVLSGVISAVAGFIKVNKESKSQKEIASLKNDFEKERNDLKQTLSDRGHISLKMFDRSFDQYNDLYNSIFEIVTLDKIMCRSLPVQNRKLPELYSNYQDLPIYKGTLYLGDLKRFSNEWLLKYNRLNELTEKCKLISGNEIIDDLNFILDDSNFIYTTFNELYKNLCLSGGGNVTDSSRNYKSIKKCLENKDFDNEYSDVGVESEERFINIKNKQKIVLEIIKKEIDKMKKEVV